jgi:surface polysaccharide O-acyltransferase-like enzyme
MVVVLHVLGHGGILDTTAPLSAKYNVAWLLESLAYCAVNGYALITGYVYIKGKYKFSSLIQICLQAVLYSLGIIACIWILKPGSFSIEKLVYFAFPASKRAYWYLSSYVGLFLLMPILNAGINALSEMQAKKFLCVTFFAFTVITTFSRTDAFAIKNGYSTFWLMYLYVIGACIRKFEWGDKLSSIKAALIYVCSILLSWGIKIGQEGITALLSGEAKNYFEFINYTSPTMLIAAIALFFAFKNARVPQWIAKIISIFAPAAFGVYLIHEHETVRAHFVTGKFAFLAEYSAPVMIAGALASAMAIFTVCLVIDWIRHKVFTWLRVKERLEHLENKIQRCWRKQEE